jgi:beta-glucanase (GH16 family)
MRHFLFCLLIVTFATTAKAQHTKLVWSDEFNYTGLPDSTKWSYETGGDGWGNNELEFYTARRPENARVEKGMLVVEARKEKWDSSSYTSARLATKNKGDWTYGRMEIRAQLPEGKGIWPAIWMLPTKWVYGGWPHSGEIDIMENVGYMADSVFGSIHTGAYNHVMHTQRTQGVYLNDLSKAFHVYAIDWDAEGIRYYIDGHAYLYFANEHKNSEAWPFDQAFHLLINIAVGGNWGGKYGVDDRIFPQRMLVDYVRVYQ